MVQLINGLDFVFLCVEVWLCTIENQSLKQRKKAFEPRKKLHHNIYLRPFYRTLKAAIIVYNQLLFFFYEDDENISYVLVGFQVLNKLKYIKAHEEEYLGHFVFVDV